MKLFRPIGPRELALIETAAFRAFPPRLPEQPIFYPVLNFAYAEQIASDWNATDPGSDFLGYVPEFEVDGGFAARYAVKVVGAAGHQELWVPTEELEDFNRHLLAPIRVIAE